MDLFATRAVEEVTVQDIATAVDMTPAAVYYHFASKEQILTEGMQVFRDQLLAEIRAQVARSSDEGGLGDLLRHVLTWVSRRRPQATVYFLSSIGLNQTVEALRRETRVAMVALLGQAVRANRGRLGSAETGVISVALVSLLETSLASMLNQDAAFRQMGIRRLGAEIAAIGERMAGVDGSPAPVTPVRA
jgi:AcrR family transcriptional regulator